jgi:hypothetical protein
MRNGYSILFASSRGDQWVSIDQLRERYNVTCFALPMVRKISPLKDLFSFLKLFAILVIKRPSFLIYLTPKAAVIGACAGFFAGVKNRIYIAVGFLYSYRKDFWSIVFRGMDIITCAASKTVICLSKSNIDFIVGNKICKPSKATILCNGSLHGVNAHTTFNRDCIMPEAVVSLKGSFKITENNLVFGFVGRLVKDKGVLDLVK